jgi:hypothetical protein
VSGLWWKCLLVGMASFAFLGRREKAHRLGPCKRAGSRPRPGRILYTNAALRVATQENWLTPIVIGRTYFHKPPLLYMVTGLLLKTFGPILVPSASSERPR